MDQLMQTSIFGDFFKTRLNSMTGIFANKVGFQDVSLPYVVGFLIQLMISILAVLFIVLIFYGGYKWMMAKGNEQEVDSARAIIRQSIIGLIVVLSSYAIGYFILYWVITFGSAPDAPSMF